MNILITPNYNDKICNGIVSGLGAIECNAISWNPEEVGISDITHNKEIRALFALPELVTDNVIKVCKEKNIQLIRTTDFANSQLVNDNFKKGDFAINKQSDILVISNYDNGPESQKRIIWVANEFPNTKIIGRKVVNHPKYLGLVDRQETQDFLASTKIVFDYDDSYYNECIYNDICQVRISMQYKTILERLLSDESALDSWTKGCKETKAKLKPYSHLIKKMLKCKN